MSQACQSCARAVSDGYLCAHCTAELAQSYRAMPDLITELMITSFRMDRIAMPGGGKATKGQTKPLPFKVASARLLGEVGGYHDATAGHIGLRLPRRLHSNWRVICLVLAARVVYDARHDETVGVMAAKMAHFTDAIRTMIDLPISFRYLGRCDGCQSELYADRNVEAHQCSTPGCEAVYDVLGRVAELLERSRDVVASPSTIATALTSLEVPVTEALMSKWRARGLLTPRSMIGRHPSYRVGDVLDLMDRANKRRNPQAS